MTSMNSATLHRSTRAVTRLSVGMSLALLCAVSGAQSAPGDTLATVNGQPVRRALLEQMIQSRTAQNPFDEAAGSVPHQPAPVDRQQLLADLLTTELLAQKAVERGIDQDPHMALQRQLQQRTVLSQEYVREVIKTVQISDAEVRALYEARVPPFDYRLSQIVVADEALARQLLDRLRQGENFAKLARQHSTEPDARARAGRLDWMMFNQLPPPVAEAIVPLAAGALVAQPIQTPQGWHVVRLDAKRAAPRPSFEEASVWLRPRLVNEKVQAELKRLRSQAQVQLPATP